MTKVMVLVKRYDQLRFVHDEILKKKHILDIEGDISSKPYGDEGFKIIFGPKDRKALRRISDSLEKEGFKIKPYEE